MMNGNKSSSDRCPFNSGDDVLNFCQPIAAASDKEFCQPGSPKERVTLGRTDISDFVNLARAKDNEVVNETDIDLRLWVELETLKTAERDVSGLNKKLTVAFAIGKLLQHLKSSVTSYPQDEILRLGSVDNFTVKMVANSANDEGGWEVIGIDMISPQMSIQVKRKSPAADAFEDGGNCIDVVVTRHSPFCCAKLTAQGEGENDFSLCVALGLLVKFIFSDGSTLDGSSNCPENPQETHNQSPMYDFLRALSISPSGMSTNTNGLGSSEFAAESSRPTKSICMPSQCNQDNIPGLDVPSPISRLVKDLLSCQRVNDIFEADVSSITLDLALDDLHILLTRPNQFLFGASQQLQTVTTIYGRSSESCTLLGAFHRVATSGQSEAFFVKGFSGSGKTRLVQGVVNAATAAGWLVVQKKFEENSTNQLYLVLSAFNDLCEQLAERYCFAESGGASTLWHKLVIEFGSSLHMLANILPNIIRLTPSPAFSLAQGTNGDVNFFSLCDIIKRFMRVLSTTSIPVLMMLDDLQWSDSVSLGIIHTVLSDMKGASCMLFVGCYRSNQIHETHVLHGFNGWLSTFNVPFSTIHLGGLSQEDVLSLVSDSLGMLPRLCRSLSQVVHRKTEGNPLFVQTFIRSIVDKRMLTYSPRERSWIWDIDEIHDECITPNVLDLLGDKMAACSSGVKIALKVASCFGIRVDKAIVEMLSGTSQYCSLLADLNKAVGDGMIDLDAGSNYKFVHDKVREAACDMIDPDGRTKFHFNLGMLLYSIFKKRSVGAEDRSGILFFTILGQINRGVPALLQDEEQRASIAKMNHDVATQMMESYNYTAAFQFAERAASLLPEDCWSQNYDMSIDVYYLLSKAAFSNKKIESAMSAISKVIEHLNWTNAPQLKLDAYKLKHDLLLISFVPTEIAALLNTMLDVLASLGENLNLGTNTDNISEITAAEIHLALETFKIESDDVLLNANRVVAGDHMLVMEAYFILSHLAYLVKPELCPFFITRWTTYTLRNKVMSKHTPETYVSFAAVLCKDSSCYDMKMGHRIGKLGLKILREGRYESMLPAVYLTYYGYVGCLFEPLQAVIDMHRQAIDFSLNLGNSSCAALHEGFVMARNVYVGANLKELKKIIERGMNMQDHPGSSAVLLITLREQYEGVCALIGDTNSSGSDTLFDNETSICPYNVTRMMTCCFLGHFERAMHLAKRWELASSSFSPNHMPKTMNQFRKIYSCFYYGISCIGLCRKKDIKKRSQYGVSNNAHWLGVIKCAARCSRYNFENKRALLMAEKHSLSAENASAEKMYDAAIKASKSSHFVHEEGLSCELAGAHYERLGKNTKALELYKQAESCYELWGSVVKARQMKGKLASLELKKM